MSLLLCSLQEGLVNVGWMDCSTQAELCDSFEVTTSTTAFFPPGSSLKNKGSVLVREAHVLVLFAYTKNKA